MCLSTESGGGFATGGMASGIDVSMYFSPVRVALRTCLPATNDSFEAERDHLLGDMNPYKMGKEQLKKLISEKDASIKTLSTCL